MLSDLNYELDNQSKEDTKPRITDACSTQKTTGVDSTQVPSSIYQCQLKLINEISGKLEVLEITAENEKDDKKYHTLKLYINDSCKESVIIKFSEGNWDFEANSQLVGCKAFLPEYTSVPQLQVTGLKH